MRLDMPSQAISFNFTSGLLRSIAPGKRWCLHPFCNRSFPSKRQSDYHGYWNWEQPEGGEAFLKMTYKGKAYEQVDLPVEIEEGFDCEKYNRWF